MLQLPGELQSGSRGETTRRAVLAGATVPVFPSQPGKWPGLRLEVGTPVGGENFKDEAHHC